MRFNVLSCLFFIIISCINIICISGLSLDDKRNIEAVIKVYFNDASESCKDEYRHIQKLMLEKDEKAIQNFLSTYRATTCEVNTVAFSEISKELYNFYRNYPRDRDGNKCNEKEVQYRFDQLGICRDECYTKIANFLYIYRYHFRGSRLHRNQMQLMETCGDYTKLVNSVK
ncbi:hypothetical protein BCR36DRAFT_587728 [Piromyces finnis]|uniref:Uncharacterized protein n=1 Tax=Piromyces finnis TaxID=1754191 RepID=A0A1Y1UUY5_9FUNG|nr:hypothetical protein BCR36DRAFT_587728 [Piromyces finnis]|eukprot:ORX41786.1 hypothetical protein BCR36DRAFT_587728 [Piromyces finnis]